MILYAAAVGTRIYYIEGIVSGERAADLATLQGVLASVAIG